MDIKKALIGLSATVIILLSLFAPMLLAQPVYSSSEEYMTVSGVLATDTYILYPYKSKSLKIGFSKYGEMIDGVTNIGLEYDGVDPFANDRVIKSRWVNGWLINITYFCTSEDNYRNVWACALFSDTRAWGGPWLRVDFPNDYSTTYGYEDPRDPGYVIGATPYPGTARYGGRKTNGTAVTEDIKVLYNGPRLFVAQLSTTIYDHPLYLDDSRDSDIPLVRLVFTIIFNKVKKQVVILKDVKSLLESKYGYDLRIQFSNRGEVDLGRQVAGASYLSNAYFWTEGTQTPWDPLSDGWPTVYDAAWELSQTDDLGPETLSEGYPQNVGATFDVAMAINPAIPYVWWAAFWPSLSDYTIDGWSMWWRSMMEDDPHDTSVRTADERVPFYIGEWDFKLDIVDAPTPVEGVQFRFVTVYGLTDLNDGSLVDRSTPPDCDFADAGDTRVLDREVLYQLNEVFNPWDLKDAVHKDTSRYVKFVSGPLSSGAIIPLGEPLVDATWDAYCSFAERVILLPDKVLWKRGTQYALHDADNDGAKDSIRLLTSVASGKTLKILYSTSGEGRYEWIVVGRDAQTVDSAGAALVSEAFDSIKNITVGIAGADMKEIVVRTSMPWVMHKFGTGNTWSDYYYSATDKRTALKDDWCTKWPIASSNMIAVGGPVANLLAYYFNDFTAAFFGLSEFAVGSIWSDRIAALTCWNKNSYSSEDVTRYGYAVIATYKDINGTVGFLVWGHWGRDTYYATQWLWGDAERGISPGIEQLQEAPPGATAIILRIDYAKPEHPTFSIVEVLGTISETKWVHRGVTKGGIHPDP